MRAQKTLAILFKGYGSSGIPSETISVSGIRSDSREVNPGDMFVAVNGYTSDGHEFIPQAIQQGAIAVVSEKSVPESTVPIIRVDDSRHALAYLARRFFDCPDKSLIMMGVTGTNGKTTVAYLLESIMNYCGISCGLMGTVTYRWPGHQQTASHTTPDAVCLFGMLRKMKEEGAQAAAMEVSSHALALHRVAGIEYRIGIYTNLSRDHLDFHRDFQDYSEAKAKLFQQVAPDGIGIIYGDDPYATMMAEACRAKTVLFGEKATDQDYLLRRDRITSTGTHFSLKHGSKQIKFKTPLLGGFNVLNASAAVISALEMGLDAKKIQQGLTAVTHVPGRMEGFRSEKGFWVVVDYAHTPDALENALKTARCFTKSRLITIFGCGGDRDHGKRPEMGRVAADLSDFIIVTSDNPRTENPHRIIEDILTGIPASSMLLVIEDREAAIRAAIVQAKAGDTIIIAGKGHEDYQILGNERIHFDDREIVQKYLDE
ncbi:UDP-N-acetylmuramoyl-L-alanyl-D-glutamate--2,6-diaminopimelate ligase [bacterium]|nr:UDP-N-acetylmuramoyl-L-alanyl-D-glutamate--2,6-diaminopimelate ligase [bacterium]